MRVNKGWATIEYCWRFGVRPLMWMVRLAVVAWTCAAIAVVTSHVSTGSIIVFTLAYGIWEIGRSIRSIKPMNISVTRGEKLIVQSGANISVPKGDIDRLLEAIAKQEAAKEQAA